MFSVTLIPRIMRNYGLRKGRELMETWLLRPAAQYPNYSSPVEGFVTMDWVLGFERARAAYDQMIKDKLWDTPAARVEIANWLKRAHFLEEFPGTQTFGDLSQPVRVLDFHQINYRPVSGYQFIDDLAAALGAFTFYLVVAGSVSFSNVDPQAPWQQRRLGHDVTIDEVGIYVRDSYDFEGDQFLGWWAYPDDSGRFPNGYVSAMPFDGGELVTNEDFKKFRRRTGKGGDFLIFSDLKRVSVNYTFNTWDLLAV